MGMLARLTWRRERGEGLGLVGWSVSLGWPEGSESEYGIVRWRVGDGVYGRVKKEMVTTMVAFEELDDDANNDNIAIDGWLTNETWWGSNSL